MKDYMDMLGFEAKDRVTGFAGVVASVIFDLYGCISFVLTPKVTDGAEGGKERAEIFDAKRIVITGKQRVMDPPNYLSMNSGAEIGAAERPASWP